MLKCLFDITHVLKFSRLFRRQWQKHPAMAIPSLIINDHKHRSILTAQNADVALTTVGVTYLWFMKNAKAYTCALYAQHRHICALQNKNVIHKSLFCRDQTLNFVECDPGPHKTMKYKIWVLSVVRKCASGDCINDLAVLFKQKTHTLFTHCTLTPTRTTCTTPQRKYNLWSVGVARVWSP